MRFLEARDGFIKFESDEKLTLSTFIEIIDKGQHFIGQVMQSKFYNEKAVSLAKILYTYDGTFNKYNGTRPSQECTINEFDFETINRSFDCDSALTIGNFANSSSKLIIDKNSFNKKMLISIDSSEKINLITTNLSDTFIKNNNDVIVIDMLGVIDSSAKHKATEDFKLPLNSDTLQFMYEDCLFDATSDSKNLIKEIFSDLAEYTKTVSFVPFQTLKTIVDEMVEKSHIFKLLVLKNKLAKFDKLKYFANTYEEVQKLDKIVTKKTSVIDLSKLESSFQNRYLATVYNALSSNNFTGQVFIIASNSINKNNIKTILNTPKISTTFVTHSRFKYLNEFKSLFTNYILEPSFVNNEIFKAYSSILNNIPKDMFMLVGDSTNFIPLTFKQESIEISPFDDIIELDDITDAELNSIITENYDKDPQTEAIEKKSGDLINKLSKEAYEQKSPESIVSIFSDEDTDTKEEIEQVITTTNDEIELSTDPIDTNNEIEITENSSEINIEINNTDLLEETQEIITNSEEITDDEPSESFVNETEFHTNIDEIQTIEVSDEILEMTEDVEENFSEILELETNINTDVLEENANSNEFNNSAQDTIEIALQEVSDNETIENIVDDYIETEVLPISEEDDIVEEIIELDDSELDENAIVVDIEDPEEEALNREIKEDVDKVFTTIKEDTLSEADLDLIDELNSENNEEISSLDPVSMEENLTFEEEIISEGFEELDEYQEDEPEETFIEPLEEINETVLEEQNEKEVLETRSTNTPIVPVYEAEIPEEDTVISDPIEQGDTVSHAKYGVGIVEKMIKYGNKTLFSINFDNVGRRLLDPTLTEIKKS